MATDQAAESALTDSTAKPAGTGGSDSTADKKETAAKEGAEGSSNQSAAPELPDKWMAALDAEVKTDKEALEILKTFKRGLPDIAKAYVELHRKPQGIRVPDDKATPEDVAAFRKAIGAPEKPEDYKLDKEKIPKGLDLDPEWDKELRTIAHKYHLTQAQLSELHQWYFNKLAADMRVVKTTAEEAIKIVRKEMGVEYDAGMTYMNRAVAKFLNPTTQVLFARSGLGNHPEILKMFSEIGKAMGEHFFAEGSRADKSDTAPFGRRTEAEIAAALYPTKAS